MEALDVGNKKIADDFLLGFFYSRLMCTNTKSIIHDNIGLNQLLDLIRKSTTRLIVYYNNLYETSQNGKIIGLKQEAYDVNWVVQTINRNKRFSPEFKSETEKWFFDNLDRLNIQLYFSNSGLQPKFSV